MGPCELCLALMKRSAQQRGPNHLSAVRLLNKCNQPQIRQIARGLDLHLDLPVKVPPLLHRPDFVHALRHGDVADVASLILAAQNMGLRMIERNRNEDVSLSRLRIFRQRLYFEMDTECSRVRRRNGRNPNRNLEMTARAFDSASHYRGIAPVQLGRPIDHHLRRVHAPQFEAASVSPLSFGEKTRDRKSTRLNSSHVKISYAVFC